MSNNRALVGIGVHDFGLSLGYVVLYNTNTSSKDSLNVFEDVLTF